MKIQFKRVCVGLAIICGIGLGVFWAKTIVHQDYLNSQDFAGKLITERNQLRFWAEIIRADQKIRPQEINSIMGIYQKMGHSNIELDIIHKELLRSLSENYDIKEICELQKKNAGLHKRMVHMKIAYAIVLADRLEHPLEIAKIKQLAKYLDLTP